MDEEDRDILEAVEALWDTLELSVAMDCFRAVCNVDRLLMERDLDQHMDRPFEVLDPNEDEDQNSLGYLYLQLLQASDAGGTVVPLTPAALFDRQKQAQFAGEEDDAFLVAWKADYDETGRKRSRAEVEDSLTLKRARQALLDHDEHNGPWEEALLGPRPLTADEEEAKRMLGCVPHELRQKGDVEFRFVPRK